MSRGLLAVVIGLVIAGAVVVAAAAFLLLRVESTATSSELEPLPAGVRVVSDRGWVQQSGSITAREHVALLASDEDAANAVAALSRQLQSNGWQAPVDEGVLVLPGEACVTLVPARDFVVSDFARGNESSSRDNISSEVQEWLDSSLQDVDVDHAVVATFPIC